MNQKKIVIALVIIVLIAYVPWKLQQAKKSIHDFSQRISIGMSVEEAESLAKQAKLPVRRSPVKNDKPDILILTVWDGWAYAKWFCILTCEKRKVVKKEIKFID